MGIRKSYGNPQWRVAVDLQKEAEKDTRMAHKEIVATLEWMERGQMDIALDRLHLAMRFAEAVLVRAGRIEREEDDDSEAEKAT